MKLKNINTQKTVKNSTHNTITFYYTTVPTSEVLFAI
jgi:hypothetical protein